MDSAPIIEELEGTYTDRKAQIKEYNYSPYNCFENTIKTDDGNYKIKGLEDKIPMVYSVKVRKTT